MTKINKNLFSLDKTDSFSESIKYVNNYKDSNPDADLINFGVGDVTLPIVSSVIKEMEKAVIELGTVESFKGYGPQTGYDFLKSSILKNEYSDFNFTNDEIYISNGTKVDTTNILDLFDDNISICIPIPSYPIYKDGANISGKNVCFLETYEKDGFIPKVPKERYDVIYLCSPNNPIGIAYDKKTLTSWVNYAINNKSIILFDNAYESFITEDIPHSIYEIDGSSKVAIEFRSFSKSAGFTGIRCSYYIIPSTLNLESNNSNINELWKKRVIAKFNGADYIAQRGAYATYFEDSKKELKRNTKFYQENSKLLADNLKRIGFTVFGGINSPFIWIKDNNLSGYELFEKLLRECNIITIPGTVFNNNDFVRVSALGSKEDILEGIKRLDDVYEK